MADRTYDFDADRMMWGDDGGPYAPPPRFSIIPNDEFVGRCAYELAHDLGQALIHLNRAASKSQGRFAVEASSDPRVTEALAACQQALDLMASRLARAA